MEFVVPIIASSFLLDSYPPQKNFSQRLQGGFSGGAPVSTGREVPVGPDHGLVGGA